MDDIQHALGVVQSLVVRQIVGLGWRFPNCWDRPTWQAGAAQECPS